MFSASSVWSGRGVGLAVGVIVIRTPPPRLTMICCWVGPVGPNPPTGPVGAPPGTGGAGSGGWDPPPLGAPPPPPGAKLKNPVEGTGGPGGIGTAPGAGTSSGGGSGRVGRGVAAGAVVDEVEAYRTDPDDVAARVLAEEVGSGMIDVLTFTAPSAVAAFMGAAPALPRGLRVVAIGRATGQAVRTRGVTLDAEAEMASVEGLVDAVLRACRDDIRT